MKKRIIATLLGLMGMAGALNAEYQEVRFQNDSHIDWDQLSIIWYSSNPAARLSKQLIFVTPFIKRVYIPKNLGINHLAIVRTGAFVQPIQAARFQVPNWQDDDIYAEATYEFSGHLYEYVFKQTDTGFALEKYLIAESAAQMLREQAIQTPPAYGEEQKPPAYEELPGEEEQKKEATQ